MSRYEIDPALLEALESEQEFLDASSSYSDTPRLMLKVGESALVRLLPMQMGKKGTWFARVPRHWVDRRPYICPKHLPAEFGGKGQDCEICSAVEDNMESKNAAKAAKAERMAVSPNWLLYGFVFEHDDGRRSVPTKKSAMYDANEIWLTRVQFNDLIGMFRKSLRIGPLGFLDPEKGFDIWMSKKKRGFVYDREETAPIREDLEGDALFDFVDKVIAKLKPEKVWQPPSRNQLEEGADKVDEICAAAAREASRDGGGGRRRRDDDDDEGDEDLPRGRNRRRDDDSDDDAPRRSRRASVEEEEDLPRRSRRTDDEDTPRARRSASVEEEEDAPRRSRRASIDEEEEGDTPRRSRRASIDEEEEGDTPRRSRRAAEEEAPRSKRAEAEEEAPRRKRIQDIDEDAPQKVTPPPAASRIQPPPARKADVNVDDDDDVTDEVTDHAPAAESVEVDDEPPPAVQSKGRLASRLRRGIEEIGDR